MLTTNKRITLTGSSVIDETTAESYSATINSDRPASMSLNSTIENAEVRKANKEQCRSDRNEFEDMAYALQDEMEG